MSRWFVSNPRDATRGLYDLFIKGDAAVSHIETVQPISFETYQQIICEVLGVDAEEATPEANFFGDLGGESIDILDLDFQCSKRFGIEPPYNALLKQFDTTDESATERFRQYVHDHHPGALKLLPETLESGRDLCQIGILYEIANASRRLPPQSADAVAFIAS
jgi:acyl carrier protein